MCKRKGFFVGKKGISVMVSYVLLIVFVIIIGAIVYQWLKTYVPAQALECPDGVSLFIKDADFDPSDSQLIITLRNNGRFDLAGYFIHATNSSDQELPTIDLSGYLNDTLGSGRIHGNSVLFIGAEGNLFTPGSEKSYFFDIPSSIGEPHLIRITPTRFQDVDERQRFVSCSDAGVGQIVGESFVCEPKTCESLGYICGTWSDGCGGTLDCEECTDPEVCNVGECVLPEVCEEDTCASLGYECGIWTICGNDINCTAETGGCDASTETCNEITGQCELNLGNGICDPGEGCSEPACDGQQRNCQVGEICQDGICVFNAEGGFNSCGDYCYLFGYSQTYTCQDNPLKCEPPQGPEGGIYIGDVEGANETYGNSFCLGDPYCCCQSY